ncbi:hypothetical protein ACU16_01605 [Xanthomonas oryzae pv. oryzicola]|nr:hypothetical protein ACU16_01605 [Xanthomonas oryzae pv. oryzicola]AKO10279.1 hypothetical protein ACU17_01655 [Xanthomonas oryzae pv. oryzicola]OWB29574.1 hypothetical protein XocBAI20_10795 [Xanthomonas oryzae pv. oryzicola]
MLVAYALKEALPHPAMANNAGMPDAPENAPPCAVTYRRNERTTATSAASAGAIPPSSSCDMQGR